jgi:hypothetical protein
LRRGHETEHRREAGALAQAVDVKRRGLPGRAFARPADACIVNVKFARPADACIGDVKFARPADTCIVDVKRGGLPGRAFADPTGRGGRSLQSNTPHPLEPNQGSVTDFAPPTVTMRSAEAAMPTSWIWTPVAWPW